MSMTLDFVFAAGVFPRGTPAWIAVVAVAAAIGLGVLGGVWFRRRKKD